MSGVSRSVERMVSVTLRTREVSRSAGGHMRSAAVTGALCHAGGGGWQLAWDRRAARWERRAQNRASPDIRVTAGQRRPARRAEQVIRRRLWGPGDGKSTRRARRAQQMIRRRLLYGDWRCRPSSELTSVAERRAIIRSKRDNSYTLCHLELFICSVLSARFILRSANVQRFQHLFYTFYLFYFVE